MKLPAGLIFFSLVPIEMSTAVLTRIPIVSFSGSWKTEFAAKHTINTISQYVFNDHIIQSSQDK